VLHIALFEKITKYEVRNINVDSILTHTKNFTVTNDSVCHKIMHYIVVGSHMEKTER